MRSLLRLISSFVLTGLVFTVLSSSLPATGQDLTYEPKNPAFGGRAVNGTFLLNTANKQDPFKGDGGAGQFGNNPLQNFERRLQRRVLNQISQQVIEERFGNIDLTEEGSFDFDQFSVDVSPGPNGISINVFNKQTGESTDVEIPRF